MHSSAGTSPARFVAHIEPPLVADSFRFLDHKFPVRGKHDYGQEMARFGAGRSGHSHQGHDVFAKCGTPLVAARGAEVILARGPHTNPSGSERARLANEQGVDSLRAVEKCTQHPGKMWVVRGERVDGSSTWSIPHGIRRFEFMLLPGEEPEDLEFAMREGSVGVRVGVLDQVGDGCRTDGGFIHAPDHNLHSKFFRPADHPARGRDSTAFGELDIYTIEVFTAFVNIFFLYTAFICYQWQGRHFAKRSHSLPIVFC